jgi:hypothetical protein
MNYLKQIFLAKKAKTFYWQTAESFVILIIAGLEGIDLIDAEIEIKVGVAILISLFINLGKWINKEYLKL